MATFSQPFLMASLSDNGPTRRPIILTLVPYYLPGFRGGGPICSLANMVTELSDEFDFRIVTADRDLGDRNAYPGVLVNRWQKVGKATVHYLSPGLGRWWRLGRLLRQTQHDLLYINGFLPRAFSIFPMLLRAMGLSMASPALLAPRGEFSPGAMEIKRFRKQLYVALVTWIGLYKNICWHASTRLEEVDIERAFTNRLGSRLGRIFLSGPIVIAPDLTEKFVAIDCKITRVGRKKVEGVLNMVFISRISRKKNLDMALRILAEVRGSVCYSIYGIIEDRCYWAECQQLIKDLPPNIRAVYRGELAHEEVAGIFQSYELFFFPTRGENYGHVIAEALLAGCPVLISDQTPWRQLREKEAGWDLPLDNPAAFRQVIQECIAMDDERLQHFGRRAEVYARGATNDPQNVEMNRTMFRSCILAEPRDGLRHA